MCSVPESAEFPFLCINTFSFPFSFFNRIRTFIGLCEARVHFCNSLYLDSLSLPHLQSKFRLRRFSTVSQVHKFAMRAVTVKTLRHLGGGVVTLSRRSLAYPAHEVVGMPALSPTMESGNISILILICLFRTIPHAPQFLAIT